MEYVYSVKITQPNLPGTFQEAMKLLDAELWRAAAKKEMGSLEDLQVYKLLSHSTVPPGKRVYKSRWVFKVKADNTHKARLVVGGWGQVPGEDCGKTYAPVCRLQSVPIVLAIAAEMDWEVVKLDVKSEVSCTRTVRRKCSWKRRLALRGRTRTAFNFS